jgi:uncharacterized protein (TIRG00374 family)
MNKSTRNLLWSLLRLGIGVGIVVFLVYNINRGSKIVEFRTAAAQVPKDVIYTNAAVEGQHFTVLEKSAEGEKLRTLLSAETTEQVDSTGTLVLHKGKGPDTLEWTGRDISYGGITLLKKSFTLAGKRWYYLAGAVTCFLGCLVACGIRWHLILQAQGLQLGFGKTMSILFVGHFFNAFMFGATGGDVVKAFYTARETGHKKTEAVSTVVIDRFIGLTALIALTLVVMLVRIRFYLSTPETRYVFVFLCSVTAIGIIGFLAMMLSRSFLERIGFFNFLSRHGIGSVVLRAYNTLYESLTHPVLFAKTFFFSLLNHLVLLVAMYLLAHAVLADLSFTDILSLGPTINAIGSIPATPGGLGLREYASVIYLGIIGTPATKALTISLLVYAMMLFWSVVGGFVFLGYSSTPLEDIAESDE